MPPKGFRNLKICLAKPNWCSGRILQTVGLVLFRIGFLYSKRGDFERAVPYLERSLKIVSPLPDNAENLGTKADLYWGLGTSYSALLQPDRAIKAFNESLKLKEKLVGADDPSLVELLIEIAICILSKGGR